MKTNLYRCLALCTLATGLLGPFDTVAAEAAGKSATVKERLAAEAAEASTSTPKEFAEFIKVEAARWSEVVKKSQIKAD